MPSAKYCCVLWFSPALLSGCMGMMPMEHMGGMGSGMCQMERGCKRGMLPRRRVTTLCDCPPSQEPPKLARTGYRCSSR